MAPSPATARRASTRPRTQPLAMGQELSLGPTKQDALLAILNILPRLEQSSEAVDVPRVLSQIAQYISKSLTASQSGKLEFNLDQNDWQIWSKYRKGLADFHSRCAQKLRTDATNEYEALRSCLSDDQPWDLLDQHFTDLATKIFALSAQPPPDVEIKYWYSITPHIFTSAEARRAIRKVGQLHQEFQWATYGGSPTKELWLFVWRTLKQMWKLYKLDDYAYPSAIAAVVSQVEEPFLSKHNRTFTLMNRTVEVLHHDQAEMMVSDFASHCYSTFSPSQQSGLVTTTGLDEDSKQSLYEFIHDDRDLTAKTIQVLRKAAAQYHAREIHDPADPEDMTSDSDEVGVGETYAGQKNVYTLPLSLPNRSAYDYVWFDLPDTRAREVAESKRIHRDMTEPGIQSDGIRDYELRNDPPRHARHPTQISRWNKYLPWNGPFSLAFRFAKFMLLEKTVARPIPKVPARISSGRFSKGRGGSKTSNVLHPIRDNARRVSKPTAQVQLPTTKLRGGGSRGNNSVVGAPNRSGSESKVSENSNLTTDKENSAPPAQNKKDETATPHPATSSDKADHPTTPIGRIQADNHPKRRIHRGSQGYVTDSHADDSLPSSLQEVPPEPAESPAEIAGLRQLQREAQQDGDFNDPDEDEPSVLNQLGDSHAISGVKDWIKSMERGGRRLSGLSGGMLQQLDMEEQNNHQLGQCHPCPDYDGQYHHVCRCVAHEPHAAESDNDLTEPQGLPFDYDEAATGELNPDLDADVSAVITRQVDGTSLNEAQLHARLRRIHAASVEYARILDMNVELDVPEWSAFLLPEPIRPGTSLSYDNSFISEALSGDVQAMPDVIGYVADLVHYHYRRVEGRPPPLSVRARQGERLRTFSEYWGKAAKLQKTLRALAELFQEVDALAGSDQQRQSHHKHHDHFRLANDYLLLVRRGLGQNITDEEYDHVPAWADYRGQGMAPHNQLYAMVMRAADAVDPIIEFFRTGDSSLAVETELLQEVMTSLEEILYSGNDGQDDVAESIEGEIDQPPGQPNTVEKVVDLTAREAEENDPAGAQDDVVNGSQRQQRRSKVTQPSNAGSQGSRGSKRKGREEQRSSTPGGKKRKTTPQGKGADETAAEKGDGEGESAAKDTSRATKSADKKSPVPSWQDYNDIMYADELKEEALHRGLPENQLGKKAKVVQLLVTADAEGNHGLGVMRSWRMIHGKKAKEGKRPANYSLPSADEVKEMFGDRLV